MSAVPRTRPPSYPWYDYNGRISPLKLAVFVALFLPGLWTIAAFSGGALGARPLNEAIHQFGLWTLRWLFIALAITPLRHVLQVPRLIVVRRMVGVAAFAYGATHLLLYIGDQAFDLAKVATEIAIRIYLTIGFVALLGLAALAATSTDRMIKRVGALRWQRLHRLVYLIGLLAIVHYCMQSKLDLWEPMIMAGIYAWLIGYRALARFAGVRGKLPLPWVAALGLVVVAATALGEALYFRLALGVDMARVLAANWSLDVGLRPAVVVAAFAFVVTAAGAGRSWLAVPNRPRPGFA